MARGLYAVLALLAAAAILGTFESHVSLLELFSAWTGGTSPSGEGALPAAVHAELSRLRFENEQLSNRLATFSSAEGKFDARVVELESRLARLASSSVPSIDNAAVNREVKHLRAQLRESQDKYDSLQRAAEEERRRHADEATARAMAASRPQVPAAIPAQRPPSPRPAARSVTFESTMAKREAENLAASALKAADSQGTGTSVAASTTAGSLAGSPVGCGSWLKVYVYDFPDDLSWKKMTAKFKRDCLNTHKCDSQYGGENLLAQFSLELILADFFMQSCVRTMDPEEAHLFYVPFFHDVEYRATNRPHDASAAGQAILDIMEKGSVTAWEREFKVTGKWWQRRGGADHILTMSAPVTGFRHPKGARGWTHFMVQLNQPIFLSVELTRSFLREYPACSSKNVVLPYPIPGRDWHNGAWRSKATRLFGVEVNQTVPNPVAELGIHARSGIQPPGFPASAKSVVSPVLRKPVFAYYR